MWESPEVRRGFQRTDMGFEVRQSYRTSKTLSRAVVERKIEAMKSIHIRAIGKPTEDWQIEAALTYVKRLSPFAKVQITEIKEGHGSSSKPDINKTQRIEAENLLKNLPTNSKLIALDETGHNFDSVGLSKKLETLSQDGSPLVFVIGGSWGLDQTVRDRADLILSFGKQTLPHNLARIVLLEQLYRAEAISRGKEYHK